MTNHRGARFILLRKVAEYRRYPYAQLLNKVGGEPECFEVKGASGTLYQVEVEVFWDSAPGGDLRVSATVDDGGWRAFCPLAYSFLASSTTA